MSEVIVRNIADGTAFGQDATDTILRAGLRAGLGLCHECNSGGCGSCKFELLEGSVENLWADAPGLSERDRKRGRLLACQCRATTAVTIKLATGSEYAPGVLPRRQLARLAGWRDLTRDIREFRLATEGAAEFLPGQYAMLDLPGVGASRAYSMSNTANARGIWEFLIRRVPAGRGTRCLFEQLAVGDAVGIDGPYGLAHLRPQSPRDLVCVAGGSGLAPMISIARGAAEAGLLASRRLWFFYGARTAADVCGEDMLRELPGFGDRIRYVPVVSEADQTGDRPWPGAVGFVHQLVVAELPGPLPDFEFYFAGPPPMAQAMQELLMIGHRVPFAQIHFDRFF